MKSSFLITRAGWRRSKALEKSRNADWMNFVPGSSSCSVRPSMYFSCAPVVPRLGQYANCDGDITLSMVNLIYSTITCSASFPSGIIGILVGNVYTHWGCYI